MTTIRWTTVYCKTAVVNPWPGPSLKMWAGATPHRSVQSNHGFVGPPLLVTSRIFQRLSDTTSCILIAKRLTSIRVSPCGISSKAPKVSSVRPTGRPGRWNRARRVGECFWRICSLFLSLCGSYCCSFFFERQVRKETYNQVSVDWSGSMACHTWVSLVEGLIRLRQARVAGGDYMYVWYASVMPMP